MKISSSLRLCTSVAALVTAAATTAYAQQPASTETVTVTGTRITNGAAMPTPVTTVDTDELLTQSPVSIPDALMQLPQFAATTNARTQVMSNGRGYGTPTPGFNLYGLGTIRTLTLLDGQRVVGAYYTGVTDVSLFPQLLIQRVDVVNGGASASYGSDAVGGVVNFITDTRFTGLKGNVQAGISKYDDNKQGLVQLARLAREAVGSLGVAGQHDDGLRCEERSQVVLVHGVLIVVVICCLERNAPELL